MGLDRLARGKLVSEPLGGSTRQTRATSPMTRRVPRRAGEETDSWWDVVPRALIH